MDQGTKLVNEKPSHVRPVFALPSATVDEGRSGTKKPIVSPRDRPAGSTEAQSIGEVRNSEMQLSDNGAGVFSPQDRIQYSGNAKIETKPVSFRANGLETVQQQQQQKQQQQGTLISPRRRGETQAETTEKKGTIEAGQGNAVYLEQVMSKSQVSQNGNGSLATKKKATAAAATEEECTRAVLAVSQTASVKKNKSDLLDLKSEISDKKNNIVGKRYEASERDISNISSNNNNGKRSNASSLHLSNISSTH